MAVRALDNLERTGVRTNRRDALLDIAPNRSSMDTIAAPYLRAFFALPDDDSGSTAASRFVARVTFFCQTRPLASSCSAISSRSNLWMITRQHELQPSRNVHFAAASQERVELRRSTIA